MQTMGLYIHIPFCEKKCDYCNFISFKTDEETKERYVLALLKELEMYSKKYQHKIVDTIFIGGGTPSVLREKSIKNIVDFITHNFNVKTNAEISIEANPNSLTLEKLKEYRLAGINRLSIGLQSYNDSILKLIGRLHTKKDFDKAIGMAKKIGFNNINVDLLLGLPTQKLKDVKIALRHLVRLKIPHISCYGLIVEENTKLFDNLKNNVYSLPDETKSVKMYDFTYKYLKRHKLNRYEVSNFAKKGFESKHNLKYWNMQEYLGVGLASHSFIDNKRIENETNLQLYFDKLLQNQLPVKEVFDETPESLKEEFILTELRKQSGFSLKDYELLFNEDILLTKQKQLANLLKLKLIKLEDDRLCATDKGFKMLNQIILELV